ncbi:MAG: hypothetical protein ACR2IP_05115 [Solirubrobacteraceae bacterium]
MKPDLDHWLADATLRVAHRREVSVPPEELWDAARTIRLRDAAMLGRLIRARIPGIASGLAFDELFRAAPFVVLDAECDQALLAGLVGRIWTLRRDYPRLAGAEEFRRWSRPGTARVLFANWVQDGGAGRSALVSETRVQAIGAQGRLGVAAVRPLVSACQHLVASDGIEAAVRLAQARRAERRATDGHPAQGR